MMMINSALITGTNYTHIFNNVTVFTVFDQINAALVSRRDLFQKP